MKYKNTLIKLVLEFPNATAPISRLFLLFYHLFSALGFNSLYVQYINSVICRRSDRTGTVGRPPWPKIEPGTGDLEAVTLTTTIDHLFLVDTKFAVN